jgi:2,5-furandicarboxylate decarboxylase 1
MAIKDIRTFIGELEKRGELLQIKEELDPKYEISGVLKALDEQKGPAVLFQKPKGYTMPVVGNIMGTRSRLAMAMGVDEHELIAEYLRKKNNPIPPKVISDAAVKDVVLKENIDIPGLFPVVTYNEKDSNPYLTAGVVIVKDPNSGVQTMGLHRLQVMGKNRLTILLLSPPIPQYYRQMEEQNKPLEVAIAIGVDPVFMFSTVAWMPVGTKFDLVGSLYEEPAEMIKGETVDLNVPVHAEIVLEGKILPHLREKDGPFGETSGYYVPYESPVIEIDAVTHRKDPYFQALHPWTHEAFVLMVSWEAETLKNLQAKFPGVRQLNLMPETVGAHAVIGVSNKDRGETRQLMLSTLIENVYIKRVVVVDDDIDVYNPGEVDWALSSRFQADSDLVVIPDLRGSPLDPSTKPGYLTAKMGMDATKPLGEPEKFEKVGVPRDVQEKMSLLVDKHLKDFR